MQGLYSYSLCKVVVSSLLWVGWVMSILVSSAVAQESSNALYTKLQQFPLMSASEQIWDPSKPVLLKLWASWCPICLAELEQMEKWQTDPELAAANIATLVSPGHLGEKPVAEFQQWFQSLNHKNLVVLLDQEGSVVSGLGVRGYPSWALFNAQGQLLRVINGSLSKSQAQQLIHDPTTELSSEKKSASTFPAAAIATAKKTKTIYLAGGCFWGVEGYFQRIHGVLEAISGYANGLTEHPSYEDVIYRNTGHAEAVKVIYDPAQISLHHILLHFFRIIDPTSLNRQGNDRGTQYRTGIYTTNTEDQAIAQAALDQLQSQYQQLIVVENQPLVHFFKAEEYHQDYLQKNPNGYCHIDLRLADKPL